MSDQNSLAVRNSENVLATVAQMKREYLPVLREMIVGGKRLSDEQIVGRITFAAQQGLDPVSEVNTGVDNTGKTLFHSMHINGLRRKNQEAIGNGESITMQFVELSENELAKFKTAAFGYHCLIRDSVSYRQWQKTLTEVGRALRDAMGQPVSYQDIISAVGPSPVSDGIGIVYQSELSEYKDRNFNPAERAKKRAEVNARHHRWSTNAPVFDGESVVSSDENAIEAEYSDVRDTTEQDESEDIESPVKYFDEDTDEYSNALEMTTDKGTPFGRLTPEQLKLIMDRSTDESKRNAARVIYEHDYADDNKNEPRTVEQNMLDLGYEN